MSVGEEEDGLLVLDGQLVVQNLQVFAEGGLAVASAERDLKHLADQCNR